MVHPDDSSYSLGLFDGVLDRLRVRLQEQESDALDVAVRGYVEDAVEAARSAASRLRAADGSAGDALSGEVREAIAVARALLAELRASAVQSWALVDRSLELRRRALRACATAGSRTDDGSRPLEGVRVLVMAERPDLAVKLTAQLCALGAEVHAALGLRHALEAARMCRPHVLLCDVSPPAAGAPSVVHDFRREGVIVPTVALAPFVDTATREAGRGAGFAAVLAADATSLHLSDAIRQAAS